MKKIENKRLDNLSEEQKKKLKEILEENSEETRFTGCIETRTERIINSIKNIFR